MAAPKLKLRTSPRFLMALYNGLGTLIRRDGLASYVDLDFATNDMAAAMSDPSHPISPANLAALFAINVQTFTTVGANIWTKPAVGHLALVQAIGAAGGGARRSAGNGAGGGGGAYFEKIFLLSNLGATEPVTIGAGGAIQLTDNADGNPGGLSSFGTWMTIYGGRGGQQAAAGVQALGGGSSAHYDGWSGGAINATGLMAGIATSTNYLVIGQSGPYGASATGATAANAVQTGPLVAMNGGAGGAGHSTSGPASGVANTSQNGGNGGAGNFFGAGGNGTNPGGGGGSGTTQGGSGGNARFIVTVF